MELSELLRRVTATLERLGVSHFVTGSMATVIYGEPRFTNDIDLVVDLGEDAGHRLADSFPPPEWYLDAETVERAIRGRGQFNLLHPASGLKVDFMVAAGDEFDRERFARSRSIASGDGWSARYASPEDVILKKLSYYRLGGSEKHLRDVAGIMRLTDVDREYVDRWAVELEVDEVWRQVQRRLDEGEPRQD